MRNYIIKRLLLIPLTLLGILTINFVIIQMAPGGPVEYMLAKYRGMNVSATGNLSAAAQMALRRLTPLNPSPISILIRKSVCRSLTENRVFPDIPVKR